MEGRFAFWTALHERMGKLANRVGDPARIFAQIHQRIPMVTADEHDALKAEHAQEDEDFWTVLRDAQQESIDGYRRLIARAEQHIAALKAEKAKADARLAEARDTSERLRPRTSTRQP